MEGVWSVQQITLYWTFTTSANIYHMTCFHLLLFWHSEVHNRISYKLLTNFELTNFNQLPPSFSVLLFAMCDFGLTTTFFATVGEWCKRVFFSSFFELRLNAVFDQIMWWLFLPDCESLRPFYNLPKDFQAVRNSAHWVFVCWQITAVVEIELLTSILALTFGFE